MTITNCAVSDIPAMLQLYDYAREYQQANSLHHWLTFDPVLLEKEIQENRQWKMLEGDEIACIFMTAYDDPFIWGEKNSDPSVYIHRIAVNPAYRGNSYTPKIIEWAKEHATKLHKKFLRMDTWGDNPKLTGYYVKCGFRLLGTIVPESTAQLPEHYNCISLNLLEIELK